MDLVKEYQHRLWVGPVRRKPTFSDVLSKYSIGLSKGASLQSDISRLSKRVPCEETKTTKMERKQFKMSSGQQVSVCVWGGCCRRPSSAARSASQKDPKMPSSPIFQIVPASDLLLLLLLPSILLVFFSDQPANCSTTNGCCCGCCWAWTSAVGGFGGS